MKTILSTLLVCAVFTACKKDRSCSCKVASRVVVTDFNQNGSVKIMSESSSEYMDYRTLKEVRRVQMKDDGGCKNRTEQREYDSFHISQDSLGNQLRLKSNYHATENYSCEIK